VGKENVSEGVVGEEWRWCGCVCFGGGGRRGCGWTCGGEGGSRGLRGLEGEGIGISRYKEGTLLIGSAVGALAGYIFAEGNVKTRGWEDERIAASAL